MKSIGQPFNEQEAAKAFEESLKQVDRFNNIRLSWVIIEKSTLQPIGIQGITWDEKTKNTASIGILLRQAWHGKLIPDESLARRLTHAFIATPLKKITAHFESSNHATARLQKKLGFIVNSKNLLNNKNICYITKKQYQSMHSNN